MQPTSFTPMSGGPANITMQPAHGTLLHDGKSLDDQEYQRGDPVAIVDDGARETLTDAIQILNLRNNQYMLVLLKAVCWVPTHTEQRSGTTFLLTLYGPNLDFRHSHSERPQMGYRGIATLFGSGVYVGREVVLEGNLSRVNLDPANRISVFTSQWDALSVHSELQQPALTPSASSCASSRSPSESGDDVPPPRFYRLQGRRDSAIEIRDPESPIYKSSTNGRKSVSPKPLFTRTAPFATKYNTRIAVETPSPKRLQYESNTPTWSDLGSDDDFGFGVDATFDLDPIFPDGLDLCLNEPQFDSMIADSDLQVNFVFLPQQNGGSDYAPGHAEHQRPNGNGQEPLWPTHGIPAGHETAWDPLQMPPQHAPEMRPQQLPMPQRQQQPPMRQAPQPEYYEQYRLGEDQASSHMHSGLDAHHPQQPEAPHMPNDARAGYAPSQLPPVAAAQPIQGFQMQSRYPESSSRLPVPGAPVSPFPAPQEVHIVQSNRHEPRQPHPLASSSYSPVQEGTLPSSSHSQQSRRSPIVEEPRAAGTRGTSVMARRASAQPIHTFTPNGLVESFRQSTQAHIATLQNHHDQLQRNTTSDDEFRQAIEALQSARRAADDSLQQLSLLQPITGIPLKGTEKRLQSLADQIVDAMKALLPNASNLSEQSVQSMGQKVQSLKDFIEYVEGVHPEVVKRAQEPATAATGDKKMNAPANTAGRVPSAPASVSSQAADDSDSCRWVDGQTTPPPDRSSAMAQNRDRSRMFRDMTTAHGRRTEHRVSNGPEFYPPNSYSQPTSRVHSPMAGHSVPAETQHPAGHGFFQQPLPTPLQQTMQMPDFGAPMQSRPMNAYPSPASVEMMRPMQPIPSLPLQQHYTTQQENSFYLRPNQSSNIFPASGTDMPQTAYAPRSPLSFHQGTAPSHPGYYQDVRSTLPDRRTVRQERPSPYSLNHRDQRRRRGSQ
ncbi:hypothetical protein CTA1_11636 [Colletotrichum tanaceti]|uniref:Uncharacterized protein n=1 Tax=Colletotrichum tanaceti TaxID=1306861 RepID=A0A4U6XT40_9PEZI|nr:hypothetical protein CTA1_11636 [Colletotrichum tanaceti]